jgi:hypothetical protein
MDADRAARVRGQGPACARRFCRKSRAVALVALVAIAAVACAKPAGTHTAAGPSPTHAPAPCASRAAVSDNANGRSVRLCPGQTIVLRLHSTYWEGIASTDVGVLRQLGPTRVQLAGASACVPGAGCGTLTTRFLAMAHGTARITAHRRLCGEDVECAPSQQVFTLTVVVR